MGEPAVRVRGPVRCRVYRLVHGPVYGLLCGRSAGRSRAGLRGNLLVALVGAVLVLPGTSAASAGPSEITPHATTDAVPDAIPDSIPDASLDAPSATSADARAGAQLVPAVGARALGPVATAGDPVPARGWRWPLQPQPNVVATFVPPTGPYGPGHRGVDLAGTVGQPVLAVAAGTVTFAGQVGGLPVVVVDHGRLRTTYQPVVPLVGRGSRVGGGRQLGTLTAIGSHCLPLPCLHLGVRDGEVYLDPLGFVALGPVRLLPLAGGGVSPGRLPAPAGGPTGHWPLPG